jgi:hypothetical protein
VPKHTMFLGKLKVMLCVVLIGWYFSSRYNPILSIAYLTTGISGQGVHCLASSSHCGACKGWPRRHQSSMDDKSHAPMMRIEKKYMAYGYDCPALVSSGVNPHWSISSFDPTKMSKVLLGTMVSAPWSCGAVLDWWRYCIF